MSQLVEWAFRAMGPPSPRQRREEALIAKAIRESGDAEALALFGLGVDLEPLPGVDYDVVLERLREVAGRAGNPFEAFYLMSAVHGLDGEYYQQTLRDAEEFLGGT